MRMSKHSSCLIHRNFLVGISYSDATPGQSFSYNHLGQLTQITDASGTRTFACNPYGEPETDCLEANGLMPLEHLTRILPSPVSCRYSNSSSS